MPLTVKDSAAVSRIAATLEQHVTNANISAIGDNFGFRRLDGSNKTDKIRNMLAELVADGRTRTTAGDVVTNLVMAAHDRTVSGKAAMTSADVDQICADTRALGLSPGDLARPGWRQGLASARPVRPAQPKTEKLRAVPTAAAARQDHALRYIVELSTSPVSAQHRGIELEKIVEDILRRESLEPTRNIVNPGEQIDLAFVLDAQHYLIECRWHAEPQGMAIVREFGAKIDRKAVGTFGVLLSMSGFPASINTTAAQGAKLNCVGLTAIELMRVLEGALTFSEVVRRARAHASRRSLFYQPE